MVSFPKRNRPQQPFARPIGSWSRLLDEARTIGGDEPSIFERLGTRGELRVAILNKGLAHRGDELCSKSKRIQAMEQRLAPDRGVAETLFELGASGRSAVEANELPSNPRKSNSEIAVLFKKTHVAVAEFTRELFKGAVGIRRESDPDFPCDYFVVWAVANGDVDQLVALNDTWHRAIRDVAGDLAEHYRLSLDVQ